MRRACAFVALAASVASAQGIRVSGVTSVQMLELRELVTDSVPASTLSGTGEWRSGPNGVPALCTTGYAWCRFERSGDRLSAAPMLQDLTVAAWGWTEGLSFHADVRARTQLGDSRYTWPRSDDHFSVLDAYAELERGDWRSRLGRQWTMGGLGAYDYDGADVLWRHDALSVEGWTGRALLAGLGEPYTSSQLAAVEPIPPTNNGWIVGARTRFRPDALTAATLLYQRVLVGDRSGVYSERAALDASTHRFGAQFELGAAYDFASGEWNDARLRVGRANLFKSVGGSFEVRHSRPFFELWTIWGAFAPVGYDEVRGTLDWHAPSMPVTVSLRGAYRQHEQAFALEDLRRNGWRAGGDVAWLASDEFSANASYDVDIGSGGTSEDVRAGARWNRPSGLMLGLEASATQNIYEFRVGTGRIFGALLTGALPIGPDVRVVGDAGLYQHALSNGAAGPDWTQRRFALRLEWTVGRDPGAASVAARAGQGGTR